MKKLTDLHSAVIGENVTSISYCHDNGSGFFYLERNLGDKVIGASLVSDDTPLRQFIIDEIIKMSWNENITIRVDVESPKTGKKYYYETSDVFYFMRQLSMWSFCRVTVGDVI